MMSIKSGTWLREGCWVETCYRLKIYLISKWINDHYPENYEIMSWQMLVSRVGGANMYFTSPPNRKARGTQPNDPEDRYCSHECVGIPFRPRDNTVKECWNSWTGTCFVHSATEGSKPAVQFVWRNSMSLEMQRPNGVTRPKWNDEPSLPPRRNQKVKNDTKKS